MSAAAATTSLISALHSACVYSSFTRAEVLKRVHDREAARKAKQERKQAAQAALAVLAASGFTQPFSHATLSASSPAAASGRPSTGPAVALDSLPVALLFPGQGSQALGMISDTTAQLAPVARMLAEARDILGYDILTLIKDGALCDCAACFVSTEVALQRLNTFLPSKGDRPCAQLALCSFTGSTPGRTLGQRRRHQLQYACVCRRSLILPRSSGILTTAGMHALHSSPGGVCLFQVPSRSLTTPSTASQRCLWPTWLHWRCSKLRTPAWCQGPG